MVHHKKDAAVKTTKEAKRVSFQPNHLLIPNGTLLRGSPVQTGGEYKVPNLTDHHTFATKRRIKE